MAQPDFMALLKIDLGIIGTAYDLSLIHIYRRSGSKVYITAAALMQSLESFNFIDYNVCRMGEDMKSGGSVKIIDNNNEHSMEAVSYTHLDVYKRQQYI